MELIAITREYYIFENGNRYSTENYTIQQAIEIASTLIDCHNCTDCSNCVNCRQCVDCNECMNCSYSTNCVGCLGCTFANDSYNSRYCENIIRCVNCIGLHYQDGGTNLENY